MKKFWKRILPLVVVFSIASLGILGCGSEPEPQTQTDYDAAADAEQAEREHAAAEAAEPGAPPPEGEETLPEEGP